MKLFFILLTVFLISEIKATEVIEKGDEVKLYFSNGETRNAIYMGIYTSSSGDKYEHYKYYNDNGVIKTETVDGYSKFSEINRVEKINTGASKQNGPSQSSNSNSNSSSQSGNTNNNGSTQSTQKSNQNSNSSEDGGSANGERKSGDGSGSGGGNGKGVGDYAAEGAVAAGVGAITGYYAGELNDALVNLGIAEDAKNVAIENFNSTANNFINESSKKISDIANSFEQNKRSNSGSNRNSSDGSTEGSGSGSGEGNMSGNESGGSTSGRDSSNGNESSRSGNSDRDRNGFKNGNSQNSKSNLKNRKEKAYQKFRKFKPKNFIQLSAGSFLEALFEVFDAALDTLPPEVAAGLLDAIEVIGSDIIELENLSGGMIPVVSPTLRIFEGMFGFDLSTGLPLTESDRVWSAVEGMVDSGLGFLPVTKSDEFLKILNSHSSISESASKVLKDAGTLVDNTVSNPAVKGRNGLRYKDLKTVDPKIANEGFGQAPWDVSKGVVLDGVTKSDMTFMRFYNDSSSATGGFVSTNSIQGRTPLDLKNGLAIPNTPTHVAVNTIPSGSEVRFGYTAPVENWGNGGLLQHQVLSGPNGASVHDVVKSQIRIPIKDILKSDGTFDSSKINSMIKGKSF